MNKTTKNILSLFISLSLGTFLIYLVVSKLSSEQIEEIKQIIRKAQIEYLLLSVGLGVFSHILRATRWRLTLEPIGYKTSFWNRFFSVFVNYFMNLAIPRMGEISRCAVLSKYENLSFEKVLGTNITERILDLLIFMFLVSAYILFEYERIKQFLHNTFNFQINFLNLFIFGIIGIFSLVLIWYISKNSKNSIILKVKKIISGFAEGVMSITKVEKVGEFIILTAGIWLAYFFMIDVCFYALEETQDVSFIGRYGSFILGGISMMVSQGGLGAYPLAIQSALQLYGLNSIVGYAFGWLVWIPQTIMVLVLGAIAFIAFPIYNRNNT